QEKLMQNIGRIRNVAQGPDGYIYVAVEGGKLIKIIPISK
ncbi:MAG: PQQ-dependent sugar dehydrogenase, partial [Chitinophagaceae bacterium]|nr:PQQ-dependent sugar dehydrogenase [Chitinophagaceae bacterium]